MEKPFTRVGKQIMAGATHYADAADETAARFMLDALNEKANRAVEVLLEALTNLLADCGETMADGYVENSIHSTEVEAARAAIARATGASV